MSQPNTPLLKLETISKKFFGSTVLENINFDLYPGEVHAIFGQNGAGKSTLNSNCYWRHSTLKR
tara:strand:- start:283 stop:474 length:192 start_codon:yes stop_codon:yes gene_type:complete